MVNWEYLGQGQATDAHSRGKLLVQDLVEMGMRMYKRCREGDVEPRKKKKEGVEDGDGGRGGTCPVRWH